MFVCDAGTCSSFQIVLCAKGCCTLSNLICGQMTISINLLQDLLVQVACFSIVSTDVAQFQKTPYCAITEDSLETTRELMRHFKP